MKEFHKENTLNYLSVATDDTAPVVQSNPAFVWKVSHPLSSARHRLSEPLRLPTWLNAVWALRGYVLYNHGDRPQFKVSENLYADPDPADFAAYHVLAYSDRKLVGCVRLLPFSKEVIGVTESFLGYEPIEQFLRNVDLQPGEAIEGGRWIAHPEYRQSRLGVLLAAAAVTLARQLDYRVLFCPVGTKDKQNRVLARLGLKPAPGIQPFYCKTFVDTLQVMYLRPTQPPHGLGIIMDGIAKKLGLARPVSTVLPSPQIYRRVAHSESISP